jgi:hypothetical protein
MAEWLGRRTLNQRVVGSNPGEGTARYLWAGYLKIHTVLSNTNWMMRIPVVCFMENGSLFVPFAMANTSFMPFAFAKILCPDGTKSLSRVKAIKPLNTLRVLS